MRSLIGGLRAKVPVPYAPARVQAFAGTSGSPMASGVPREQHLQAMGAVGTLFAIVSRTSEATSQVDWHLYRKPKPGAPSDQRVEVTKHAALDLWNKPNPFMTRQELIEAGQQHYELTGEEWWLVSKTGTLPLELWPVRPDRMRPVPSVKDYLAGYVYRGPDGDEVPLQLGEVIFIRRPNPLDSYRGLGVVQSILVDLDSARFSAEWNRNFFINSAEPGGIIQVDKRLSDDEFTEMVMRWREQHQGVAQAHRVAVLEQGKWIDRKFSMKDMDFTGLRQLSSETIREAFGFPKPLLGTVTDVNLANAQTAEVVFARWLLVPRLERLKQALNNDLLPMFGSTTRGLEFDYDSPVPEDANLEMEQLTARTTAYVLLTAQGGVEPESASEVCGLPVMEHAHPPVAGPIVPPDEHDDQQDDEGDGSDAGDNAGPSDMLRRITALERRMLRAVAQPRPPLPSPPDDDTPATLPAGAGPDLAPVQHAWETALATAVTAWLLRAYGADVDRKTAQFGVAGIAGALVEQIREAVAARDLLALTRLVADTSAAGDDLAVMLVQVADDAARHVVVEAAAQGVAIGSGIVDRASIQQIGQLAASTLGDGLRISAAREAARVWGPGISADTIAGQVADHLASLTPAQPQLVLGGALTGSQAAGREATILNGPSAALYASESEDVSTCANCSAIDGMWLGNSGDVDKPWRQFYPVRGYVDCLGGDRCRGTVVALWRGGNTWQKFVEPVEGGA